MLSVYKESAQKDVQFLNVFFTKILLFPFLLFFWRRQLEDEAKMNEMFWFLVYYGVCKYTSMIPRDYK